MSKMRFKNESKLELSKDQMESLNNSNFSHIEMLNLKSLDGEDYKGSYSFVHKDKSLLKYFKFGEDYKIINIDKSKFDLFMKQVSNETYKNRK
jgi:hypothetical protein